MIYYVSGAVLGLYLACCPYFSQQLREVVIIYSHSTDEEVLAQRS